MPGCPSTADGMRHPVEVDCGPPQAYSSERTGVTHKGDRPEPLAASLRSADAGRDAARRCAAAVRPEAQRREQTCRVAHSDSG